MSQLHLLEQYIEHNEIFKVKKSGAGDFFGRTGEKVWQRLSADHVDSDLKIFCCITMSGEEETRQRSKKMLQNYNLLDRIQSLQEIRQKIIEMVMECVSTESVADANARSKIQMAIGYIQEHFAENLRSMFWRSIME